MGTITVQEGQSLFDIAIQACGAVAAVAVIASLNGLSVTDEIVPGTIVYLPESVDRPVSEFYRLNRLAPATGATGEGLSGLRPEGIGHWGVFVDFVVQ